MSTVDETLYAQEMNTVFRDNVMTEDELLFFFGLPSACSAPDCSASVTGRTTSLKPWTGYVASKVFSWISWIGSCF